MEKAAREARLFPAVEFSCALLPRYSRKCCLTLLDFLTAAVGAAHVRFCVLDGRQNFREESLAVVAEKFVAGHKGLLGEGVVKEILELRESRHNDIFRIPGSTSA